MNDALKNLVQEAKVRLPLSRLWVKLGLRGEFRKRVILCPVHDEKTPSCGVDPDDMLWKCMGCDAGGDAVSLIEQTQGMGRGEAMRYLCELAGLQVPERGARVVAAPVETRVSLHPLRRRDRPVLEGWGTGERTEWEALATLRGLRVETVARAVAAGNLLFGDYQPGGKGAVRRCWLVTDTRRVNAQARRLDGLVWWTDGPKALTLPGSWATWPLGCEGKGPEVVLCEGGPDFLAAHQIALEAGLPWVPVGMLGAAQEIHEAGLLHLAGRRVHVAAHNDAAGAAAFVRWRGMLEKAGCTVKKLGLPAGVKDLNDYLKLPREQRRAVRVGE